MERKLVSARYVPYAIARALLAKRMQEGEVPEITLKTWNYLRQFGEGDEDLAAEAMEKLTAMGVSEEAAAVILSICPKSPGEVRSILQIEGEVTYDEEKLKAILDAIRDFCKTARSGY
ncbi:Rpb4 family DNA-directed RNA polymerase subunit [Stetteria hydrogenophila]